MDKLLFQAFQNLPGYNVSDELHAKILRAAMFRKYRNYVIYLTIMLLVAFAFSLWHFYTRSVDNELPFTLKIIWDTLDLSVDSLVYSAKTLVDALPVQALVLTILNFVALAFMALVLRSFSRIQEQFIA